MENEYDLESKRKAVEIYRLVLEVLLGREIRQLGGKFWIESIVMGLVVYAKLPDRSGRTVIMFDFDTAPDVFVEKLIKDCSEENEEAGSCSLKDLFDVI